MKSELEKLIENWEAFKPVGHPNVVIWDSFINDAKKALEKEKNKWIKIESEKDLPKEKCLIWVMYDSGKIEHAMFYNDFFTPLHSSFPKVTHYQTIKKPEPPLF